MTLRYPVREHARLRDWIALPLATGSRPIEPRQIIAYSLLALLAVFVAAIATWLGYNTHDRKIARQRLREQRARELRALEADPDA